MNGMGSSVELRNDEAFLAGNGISNVPGCYAVFGPLSDCLYVGASKRVLNRVMNHFVDQDASGEMRWRISGSTDYFQQGPPLGS